MLQVDAGPTGNIGQIVQVPPDPPNQGSICLARRVLNQEHQNDDNRIVSAARSLAYVFTDATH